MKNISALAAATFAAMALSAVGAEAAAPSVVMTPERARPGTAVLVKIRGLDSREGARAPAGELGSAPLRFFRVKGGWQAVGAVPLDSGPGPLTAKIDLPDGSADRIERNLDVVSHSFPSTPIEVEEIFVDPPADLSGRILEDQRVIAAALRDDAGDPLFHGSFRWPRKRTITSHFGEFRLFNGVKNSQHLGTDLAGKTGAPIGAANGGEVVLVRDCFYTGNTVLIRHGVGIYTAYFHLSQAAVEAGQSVTRGQVIGRVGDSGRTTGPHLHYSVRVGKSWVDPESFMALPIAAPLRSEIAAK